MKNIKTGDYIVCVDNYESTALTIGKRYIVTEVLLEIHNPRVRIINDFNDICAYYTRRFQTIDKIREDKIIKILE